MYLVGAIWTVTHYLLYWLELNQNLDLLCPYSTPHPFLVVMPGYKFPCSQPYRSMCGIMLPVNAYMFYLINLLLPMTESQSHRTRLTLSLLWIISEQAQARFAIAVIWACPSFLLSLILVNLYAQNNDSSSSCFCWRLFPSQNGWDEVKGLCPLVNEEICPEARNCRLWIIAIIYVLRLAFCHCFFCFFQRECSLNLMFNFYWSFLTGYRAFAYSSMLWPELPMQASQSIIGIQDNVLGFYIFMYWLYFDKFWVYRLDLVPLLFVIGQVVDWIFDMLSYLLYYSKIWYLWMVAQHVCVLRMCRTALGLHRRMLGLAQCGLGHNGSIIANFVTWVHSLLCLGTLFCLKRVYLHHNRSINPLDSK